MVLICMEDKRGYELWTCLSRGREALALRRYGAYTEARWLVNPSQPLFFYAAQLSVFAAQLQDYGLNIRNAQAQVIWYAGRDRREQHLAFGGDPLSSFDFSMPFSAVEFRTRHADVGMLSERRRWSPRHGKLLVRADQAIAAPLTELVTETSRYPLTRAEMHPVLRNAYAFSLPRKPFGRAWT